MLQRGGAPKWQAETKIPAPEGHIGAGRSLILAIREQVEDAKWAKAGVLNITLYCGPSVTLHYCI